MSDTGSIQEPVKRGVRPKGRRAGPGPDQDDPPIDPYIAHRGRRNKRKENARRAESTGWQSQKGKVTVGERGTR